MIPPLLLLLAAILITGACALGSHWRRRNCSARLNALAVEWQMSFTADDRFQLTWRVAANFPIPGVADVVIRDLIYQNQTDGKLSYLFTVEYTTGVLHTKHRKSSVGLITEAPNAAHSPVILAPQQLAPVEQYDYLRRQLATGG